MSSLTSLAIVVMVTQPIGFGRFGSSIIMDVPDVWHRRVSYKIRWLFFVEVHVDVFHVRFVSFRQQGWHVLLDSVSICCGWSHGAAASADPMPSPTANPLTRPTNFLDFMRLP